MLDEQETAELDLREVEVELCRLPEVDAVRIVADDAGRPIEVHVLARGTKHAKQVVRDVQSVALASFGLELDRRIVSVVQLGGNGTATTAHAPTVPAALRPTITIVQTQTAGPRCTVRVTLSHGDDEATGFAEGTAAASARPRLVVGATLDALRQLEPAADSLDVDSAQVVRVGVHDVVVVTILSSDPPLEHYLAGSAIVHAGLDDAAVRAVLDATNRRLPFLAPGAPRD